MAHVYGDHVTLDHDLPGYVLAHPDCPVAILDARRAFEDAQAAVFAERDAVDAIKDEAEDNRAAIARAIAAGKKPPAPIPQEVTAERIRQAEAKVRAAVARTRAAAKAYEDEIPKHQAVLRPIIAAPLAELAQKAAQAARDAEAAYNEVRAVVGQLMSIDRRAALAEPEHSRRLALVALVDDHYAKAAKKDAVNFPHRAQRLPLAWEDVKAVAAGIPVADLLPDPLAAPDFGRGYALVMAAERAEAQFRGCAYQ